MTLKSSRYSIIILLGDIVFTLLATQISSLIRFEPGFNIFSENTGATVFTILIYIISLYIFDLYDVTAFNLFEVSSRILGAVILAGVFSTLIFYTLPHWRFGRGIFLLQLAFSWCGYLLWRIVLKRTTLKKGTKTSVIVVGAGEAGRDVVRLLHDPNYSFDILGFIDDGTCTIQSDDLPCTILGPLDRLEAILADNPNIMVILAMPENRNHTIIQRMLQTKMKGIEVIDMAVCYEQLAGRIPVRYLRDEWLLCAEGFHLVSKRITQKIKRITDIVFSAFLLLLTFPLCAITALAIVVESRGPVFYRQQRVGRNGQIFEIFKFRSMRSDAEAAGKPVWASEDDPRITHVGKIIRALRIDEIPQVINIFKGDMSLIGPRPERPEFVMQLEKEIPYYNLRHSVPPGITGWAQVNYPYGASIEDTIRKLEYDLYYIKNMSYYLDMKICLLTIGVVLFGHGAR